MNLDKYQSTRYFSFTNDQKNVVKAGVELYQHYLYTYHNRSEFEEIAKKGNMSYEEKEKIFNASLKQEALKMAGLANVNIPEDRILRNPTIRWALFELVSETLSIIIPLTVQDQFNQFAEIRQVGWGDTLRFKLPNPNLFVVSKTANGKRRGHPQRLWNSEVVLNAEPHEVTIKEDFYRVLTGQINWGEWINKVALSVQTKITMDVFAQLFNSYDGLGSNFKEASWDKERFIALGQRVEAANGGSPVTVFGTKLALSKVVPDAEFSKFGYVGIGEYYNTHGYLPNFMGFPTFVIDQRIAVNDPDYNFAIDDNTLYFISTGTDKPVKIGFEGQPIIQDSGATDSASMSQYYTYIQYFDAVIATSAHYGIMKV